MFSSPQRRIKTRGAGRERREKFRRHSRLAFERLEDRRVLVSVTWSFTPSAALVPGTNPFGHLDFNISGLAAESGTGEVKLLLSGRGNFNNPDPLLPDVATMWSKSLTFGVEGLDTASYSGNTAPLYNSSFLDAAHFTTPTNSYKTMLRVYSDGAVIFSEAGPSVQITDHTIDVKMDQIRNFGDDQLLIDYTITNGSTTTLRGLDIAIVKSSDAFYSTNDTILKTISLPLEQRTRRTNYRIGFPIGSGPNNVPLPGNGAPETNDEYYLLAVADPGKVIAETDSHPWREDNTKVYLNDFYPGSDGVTEYRHLNDGDDIAYVKAQDTPQVRLRTHGGNDDVELWSSTAATPVNLAVFLGDSDDSAPVYERDRATLKGTSLADTATLQRYSSTLTNTQGAMLAAYDADNVSAYGEGGNDHAILRDSIDDDQFSAGGGFASMRDVANTCANDAYNFPRIEGYAANVDGGYDTADIRGNGSANRLVASPNLATMKEGGVDITARKFERVNANGDAGGDIASLTGSAENDFFVGAADHVELHGPDLQPHPKYFLWATGIETVIANGGAGLDQADLHDTSGNDSYTGRPQLAVMASTNGLLHRANGFEKMFGHADQGGTDTANLYDSEGEDKFDATGDQASLSYGLDHANSVDKFDKVFAYHSQGDDTATFRDTAGVDTFISNPELPLEFSQMLGTGYFNRANGFPKNVAIAPTGGAVDKAFLYGDPDDLFRGSPNRAGFEVGFYDERSATGFEQVVSYADTSSTLDVNAYLEDGPLGDVLRAYPQDVKLTYSAGNFIQVKNFDRVEAESLRDDDTDTAFFQDGPGADYFESRKFDATTLGNAFMKNAAGNSDAFYNLARGFETITAHATQGGEIDSAKIVGNAASDTAVLDPFLARMGRTTAFEYERNTVVGGTQEADDFVVIKGTGGDDTLTATQGYTQLVGTGYFLRAEQFEDVEVHALAGNDTATLTGSNGSDTFTGSGFTGELNTNGVYISFDRFETVEVRSGPPGGTNVYDLNGVLYLLDFVGPWTDANAPPSAKRKR